jgi:hypothetical protein
LVVHTTKNGEPIDEEQDFDRPKLMLQLKEIVNHKPGHTLLLDKAAHFHNHEIHLVQERSIAKESPFFHGGKAMLLKAKIDTNIIDIQKEEKYLYTVSLCLSYGTTAEETRRLNEYIKNCKDELRDLFYETGGKSETEEVERKSKKVENIAQIAKEKGYLQFVKDDIEQAREKYKITEAVLSTKSESLVSTVKIVSPEPEPEPEPETEDSSLELLPQNTNSQMIWDNRVRSLLASFDIALMDRVALPDRLMKNMKTSIQTMYKYLRLEIDLDEGSSNKKGTLVKMTNELYFPIIGKIVRYQICPTLEGVLMQGFWQGSGFWQSNSHAWHLIVKLSEALPETNIVSCGVKTITSYHSEQSTSDTKMRAFLCHMLKYVLDS